MRNGILAGIALAMVACGSSNSSSPTVKGTIGGAAFTAADVEAIYVAPKTCTITSPQINGNVTVAGLVLAFSTTTGLCTDLNTDLAGKTCVAHANSAGVQLFLADVGITAAGGTASITTGINYAVISNPADVQVGTSFADAFGYSSRLGPAPTCAPSSTSPVTATGTILLTAMSPNQQISGHVNVTFSDGGSLDSDFTAAACASSLDICAVANAAVANLGAPISLCTGTPTCE
ncbi:MAG TPA: hypothetical protein VLV17_05795 [Anaeromyxobacteraceae bacterium]|nr:hypothetical protein [Anaeromyxobacteraceae bacterium]